jgi:hypothetical protein
MHELIISLAHRGIILSAGSDDKVVARPASGLTEQDRSAIRAHKAELLAALSTPHLTTAQSLLCTCHRYGVALRIDEDGNLVVGRAIARAEENSQPWPSLIIALEANLEEVARLVAAGWQLSADFSTKQVM